MRSPNFLFLLGMIAGLLTVEGPLGSASAQSVSTTQGVAANKEASPEEVVSDKEIPIELQILNSIEQEIKKKKGKDIYERSSVPSLVFTPSQYALLREARIGFNTRAPSLQELAKIGDPNDPNYRPPTSIRDIKLGGISFNTPDDWTIWLNNSRVTPGAMPSEAIDLRVYKDFIELKWFDVLTNQIYPVRLRTNQKFNIDSRIFLPG
jgi:hypothetical protein